MHLGMGEHQWLKYSWKMEPILKLKMNLVNKQFNILCIFILFLKVSIPLGVTSLFNATFWGNTELASLLLKSGADLNVKSSEGNF